MGLSVGLFVGATLGELVDGMFVGAKVGDLEGTELQQVLMKPQRG